jgi:hypothetical protein
LRRMQIGAWGERGGAPITFQAMASESGSPPWASSQSRATVCASRTWEDTGDESEKSKKSVGVGW